MTTDVEQRLEHLLVDLADRAPRSLGNPDLVVSRIAHRRRRRSMAGVTISIVAIVGVAASAVAVRSSSHSTASINSMALTTVPPASGDSLPVDTEAPGKSPGGDVHPLVELTPELWVVPTALPDGFVYRHATFDTESKSAVFSNHQERATLVISVQSGSPVSSDAALSTESFGGITWSVRSVGPTVREYSARINDKNLVVTESAIDDASMSTIIDGLRVGDAGHFPRPPINLGDPSSFDTAATAVTGGGDTVDLSITTDGAYYCARIRTFTGCITPLNDAAITKPTATVLSDGSAVAYGAAAPDVARIDIHLTDGHMVTVQPQDIHNAYNVNFYLIAGTYSNGLGIAEAVAFDATGNQMQVIAG